MKGRPSGTKEWAAHSLNIQTGCEHDCLYCYAKAMAIQYKRSTHRTWSKPKGTVPKAVGRKSGTIMFPTTHDITTRNLKPSLAMLHEMLDRGNKVLIVSKPTLSCVEEMCKQLRAHKERIMFRFTIGAINDNTLRFWEPGAPNYQDRKDSLEHAHKNGFNTSVSCEPMLFKTRESAAILYQTLVSYVSDAIWFGTMNQCRARVSMNTKGHGVAIEAVHALQDAWGREEIKDLYDMLKKFPKVKWKESIKAIVGLESGGVGEDV